MHLLHKSKSVSSINKTKEKIRKVYAFFVKVLQRVSLKVCRFNYLLNNL